MDLKGFGEQLPLILGAIAVVAIQYLLRRARGPVANQQEIVQNLLSEIRLDFRLAEIFPFQYQAKKFLTTTWQLNKNKLDFLDQPLMEKVNNAFVMLEDYNGQITMAKKNKTNSYMANIQIDKLKEILAATQQGLEQWLLLKVGSRNPPVKSPSMFDNLFGRR